MTGGSDVSVSIDCGTPAGAQMAWVLESLVGGADLPDDVLGEHFAPAFLEKVPPGVIRQVAAEAVPQLAGARITSSTAGTNGWVVELATAEEAACITLHVEPDPPHRMTGLLFAPVEDDTPVAAPVVLLNGTSSSGKSTLAKALQQKLPGSWLHMAVDDFLHMAHHPGASAMCIVHGFPGAVAAMVDAGCRVIMDHVLQDPAWYGELAAAFGDTPVVAVGVHCPVDVLEERERERGDRMIGLARHQLGLVHTRAVYDIEIDTSTTSAEDAAKTIAALVVDGPAPLPLRDR